MSIRGLFASSPGGFNITAVEEYLITAVDYLRLVIEAIGAAVVGFGSVAAAVRLLSPCLA